MISLRDIDRCHGNKCWEILAETVLGSVPLNPHHVFYCKPPETYSHFFPISPFQSADPALLRSSSAVLCHLHRGRHRRCLGDPHFLSSGCASTLVTSSSIIIAKRAITRLVYACSHMCSRCRQYFSTFFFGRVSHSVANVVVNTLL
jgi:hypothetical protein